MIWWNEISVLYVPPEILEKLSLKLTCIWGIHCIWFWNSSSDKIFEHWLNILLLNASWLNKIEIGKTFQLRMSSVERFNRDFISNLIRFLLCLVTLCYNMKFFLNYYPTWAYWTIQTGIYYPTSSFSVA